MLEGTIHHQLMQQALKLLQEGLATWCSLDTQRPKNKTGKDGDNGARASWLFVLLSLLVTFDVLCTFFVVLTFF